MANLQPGSSILDLGCGVARVAIAARNVLGTSHGRIVAIDISLGCLQEAQRELERAHLENEITLLHGDISGMSDIEGLRSLGSDVKPTFDVIFARNVLNSVPPEQRAAILQHWATYLTPDTGRMILTLGMVAENPGEVLEYEAEIAGILVVHSIGQVLSRLNKMTEGDWIFGERVFEDLITATGLRMGAIRRVGFDREDGFDWLDQRSQFEQHTLRRHAEILQEGHDDPASTNADGSFSRLFKAQMKSEAVKKIKQQVAEVTETETLYVVLYFVVLAVVVVA
ncbi:hypothetical protein HO173_003197 [Letharia columbiana]|uniref:Methyltransferase domain-containing protein n=1 Tax=Letharia columbiana TaxID=112416 RepID=A0A8H6L7S9_9LECA|nr:uncharacterized protein HO173_003197 [Letharia columbiana]KAF6238691.1 hypothetical protein HO173_003197 [Letharia columbiana]